MKKLVRMLVVMLVLLTTVGVGVAIAGVSKGDAAAKMVQRAYWKAAIGQGRWKAEGFVLQGPYGPAKGNPEWTGTVILMRRLNNHPSVQTCHVEVAINHDGSTAKLTIHCEYALEFARDRPHSASWS